MNQPLTCLFGITVVATTACGGPQGPTVDLQSEAAALLAAARGYLDADAVGGFHTADTVADSANEPTMHGPEGVQEYATNFVSVPGPTISFGEPDVAVAARGALGDTFALAEASVDTPDGGWATKVLREFDVWTKRATGAWLIAVDIWNSPNPLRGS